MEYPKRNTLQADIKHYTYGDKPLKNPITFFVTPVVRWEEWDGIQILLEMDGVPIGQVMVDLHPSGYEDAPAGSPENGVAVMVWNQADLKKDEAPTATIDMFDLDADPGPYLCDMCREERCDFDCNEEACQCPKCPDDGGSCEYCDQYCKGSIALQDHEDYCPNRDDEDEDEETEESEDETDE